MTIGKVKDQWAATRFGSEQQILQDSAVKFLSEAKQQYKLVKIQAFHASFLSYNEGGTLMFIPLQEDRARELFSVKAVRADLVLNKYVKAARDYNGLPM